MWAKYDVGGAECEASAINICVVYGTSVHDRSSVRDNSITHIPVNIALTNNTVLGSHFLAICVKEILLLWNDAVRSHLSTTWGESGWIVSSKASRPTLGPLIVLSSVYRGLFQQSKATKTRSQLCIATYCRSQERV